MFFTICCCSKARTTKEEEKEIHEETYARARMLWAIPFGIILVLPGLEQMREKTVSVVFRDIQNISPSFSTLPVMHLLMTLYCKYGNAIDTSWKRDGTINTVRISNIRTSSIPRTLLPSCHHAGTIHSPSSN